MTSKIQDFKKKKNYNCYRIIDVAAPFFFYVKAGYVYQLTAALLSLHVTQPFKDFCQPFDC